MFTGFSPQTVDFMWGIRFNNNKSWFEAHKGEYQEHFLGPMKKLADQVYDCFGKKHRELELQAKVSRIYRDARRLHGKGPYKDNLWFTLCRPGGFAGDSLCFWFELKPELWSYGLGYYAAGASTMSRLRARIDRDPRPMEKLARRLNRQDEFVLESQEYKKPKGDPGKLLYDWYNSRGFSLIHESSLDESLYSPELADRLIAGFEFLLPFYKYFHTLDSDPEP